jgi:AraC-like DNA-binding protein
VIGITMHKRLVFFFQPEVQEIFNHFTALFQIRIAYFSPDGEELKVGLDRPWCRYCNLIRSGLKDDPLCEKCDFEHRESARFERVLVHYRCHGGLDEAVKPLYLDDALTGFIMIGQVRTETEPPVDKVFRWRNQFGTAELASAFQEVPYLPRSQFPHVLALFSSLVDLILSRHMITISGRTRLDPLLDRMREDCSRKLSLPEAASLLGSSSYYVAHLFQKLYGKTFKQLQTEICLQRADELLARVPSITVKEVAARCGFEDPLYFSRVYHRHRGHPPSTVRTGNRGNTRRQLG